jgi:glycosyltransferase involved in cell wall biosynthesis
VADFRDFWTGYKAEDWFDNSRQVDRARRLLEEIRSAASIVTVVNPAIAEYLGQGEVIYNSFDEDRAALWATPTEKDKFMIGVLGTVDELRPIKPLFEVLSAVREKDPDSFRRVEVVHVGTINIDDHQALLDRYGLGGIFETHGFQQRERTIEILSETSTLYIGLDPAHGMGVLPGRVFDMIASGRSILAAARKGSVLESIVSQIGNGFCFDPDTPGMAVDHVKGSLSVFAAGNHDIRCRPAYAERFTSKKMVEHFVEVFDRVC